MILQEQEADMDLRVLNKGSCFLCGLVLLIAGCENPKTPVEGKNAAEV